MMNLSCNKPVTPCAGETLTITCFTCGMPSSKEWAQKVRSRPTNPLKPYFPFLLHLQPPQGSTLKEDGSTYVCAFCHASLEAQWKHFDRQPSDIPVPNRKYNLRKFICAVCGVETYRKRVRTLPFQEFPFLANQRPAGSLTLGNNPLAVVCLDCSETLWAQSAEYDRWGLPIHKRRFNWLARPPPDPDSLEATVARLPSGETQLPRCPPTEPLIKPKELATYDTGVKHKIRNSKSESNSGGESSITVRKSSLTCPTNATLETVHSQPPVVTVAPMSTHSTTLSSHKKETLSVPPNLTSASYPKYESISSCVQPPQLAHPMFPRSPMFPPSSYGQFPWAGREGSIGEHYPYLNVEALQSSPGSAWGWLPSSNLMQYHLPSSFSNRSFNINEPFYNSSHSYYPPSPESNTPAISTATSGSTSYLAPFSLQNSTRSTSPQQTAPSQHKLSSTSSATRHAISLPNLYDQQTSPPIKRVPGNEKLAGIRSQDGVLKKVSHKHTNLKAMPETSSRIVVPKKANALTSSSIHSEVNFKSTANLGGSDSLPANFKPKSNAIRNHINEKLMNSNQRKMSLDRSTNAPGPNFRKKSDDPMPKKWQYQSHNLKTSHSSDLSESEPMDCSVASQDSLSTSPPQFTPPVLNRDNENGGSTSDTVIDLSLSTSHKSSSVINSSGSSKNKFMIAYLCRSESMTPPKQGMQMVSPGNSISETMDIGSEPNNSYPILGSSGRRSVIITVPKVETEQQTDSEVTSSEHTPDENFSPLNNSSDIDSNDASDLSKHVGNKDGCIDENSSTELSVQDLTGSTSLTSSENVSTNENTESILTTECSKMELPKERVSNGLVQDFVKKVICEHRTEERQAKQLKRKLEEDQEEFLQTLGLVTPRKKAELELNILIKRSDHHTLPPLKLRPSTPPKERLGEEFENQLLKIAFDDPSLKKCDLSDDEVAFLAQLDLKPATKWDKNNREVQWSIVLKERMMREKRGVHFCGAKKPWNSDHASAKLHIPTKFSCNNSTLFGSLSVTLPTLSSKCISSTESTGSSDLLRIVDTHSSKSSEQAKHTAKEEKLTLSATCVMQPVISYPKYIPSYASQTSGQSLVTKGSTSGCDNTSNISSVPVSSRCESPETLVETATEELNNNIRVETKSPISSNQQPNEDSRILKVPVINVAAPLAEPVNPVNEGWNNSNDPAVVIKDDNPDVSNPPTVIDDIIDADALNCENFVNQINNMLNSLPSHLEATQNGGQSSWPPNITEWKKLKKYLKSRQSQIKAIEDKLKKREKQILNQLRACTNNTH